MLRIMIVDDHVVLRNGVASLLSREGDFEVIAEAGDGKEAVELALRRPKAKAGPGGDGHRPA